MSLTSDAVEVDIELSLFTLTGLMDELISLEMFAEASMSKAVEFDAGSMFVDACMEVEEVEDEGEVATVVTAPT